MKTTQKRPVVFRLFPLSKSIKPVLLPLAFCFSMVVTGGAQALSYDLGNSATLDWDTTVRYSAAWRLQDQDSALLADANGDDGNRNFDKGLIQSRVDIVSDVDLNFGNVGAFARVRGFYDGMYFGSNDHDSPATSNNQSVAFNRFTDDTQDLMGSDIELLDAFVYGGG